MKIESDGRTVAEGREEVWDDWGGEGALLMCLRKIHTMLNDRDYEPRVEFTRRVDLIDPEGTTENIYEGRGFIAEIASLFYDHFDLQETDNHDQANWH